MLSKTHNLVESMTYALGPLFHEEPDYTTIQQAIGLVIARIAMATPSRGKEFLELSIIHEYSKKALEELLNIEAKQAAQKALVEQGIGKFAAICGYVDPSFNANEDPEIGLVALNGGMGSEAQAAAEKAQAKQTANWAEVRKTMAEEVDQARQEEAQEKVPYSENELEWPQYNEGSWSPDQEETEQARLDTYKEKE